MYTSTVIDSGEGDQTATTTIPLHPPTPEGGSWGEDNIINIRESRGIATTATKNMEGGEVRDILSHIIEYLGMTENTNKKLNQEIEREIFSIVG